MSITKRTSADGKPQYLVRIDVGEPVTGKRKRQTVGTFRTKRDAEAAEAAAKVEHERGTLLKPDSTTAGELLDRWLELEMPRTVQPENRAAYEIVVRRHIKPALGTILLQRLTVEHVERFYAEMHQAGYSTSLIKKCHMRLSSALKMAKRWKLITENVCETAKVPRVSYKRAEVWTPDETRKFLEVAQADSLSPYWALAVETGARTSELLGLTWDDVDLERGRLQIGRQVLRLIKGTPMIKDRAKTEAGQRTVLLTAPMVDDLKRHRVAWLERRLKASDWQNHHDFLFCTSSGRPINPAHVRRSFTRLVREAGVKPITLHGIPKTHITTLVAAGGNIKAVAARVGHRDVTTTLKTYAQLVPQMETDLMLLVAQVRQSTEKPA